MNSSGGKPWRDLLPEQRAEAIAIESIDDAPRLLRRDEVRVEVSSLCDRFQNRFFGNFGEDHPLDGNFRLKQLSQMPADAFPFAVFVGCENEFVGLFQRGLEFADELFLFLGDDVERLEAAGYVHPEVGPALLFDFGRNLAGAGRQVTHMAHTGHHDEVATQIAADLFGLGGRFDDHQSLGWFACHWDASKLRGRNRENEHLHHVVVNGPAAAPRAETPSSHFCDRSRPRQSHSRKLITLPHAEHENRRPSARTNRDHIR